MTEAGTGPKSMALRHRESNEGEPRDHKDRGAGHVGWTDGELNSVTAQDRGMRKTQSLEKQLCEKHVDLSTVAMRFPSVLRSPSPPFSFSCTRFSYMLLTRLAHAFHPPHPYCSAPDLTHLTSNTFAALPLDPTCLKGSTQHALTTAMNASNEPQTAAQSEGKLAYSAHTLYANSTAVGRKLLAPPAPNMFDKGQLGVSDKQRNPTYRPKRPLEFGGGGSLSRSKSDEALSTLDSIHTTPFLRQITRIGGASLRRSGSEQMLAKYAAEGSITDRASVAQTGSVTDTEWLIARGARWHAAQLDLKVSKTEEGEQGKVSEVWESRSRLSSAQTGARAASRASLDVHLKRGQVSFDLAKREFGRSVSNSDFNYGKRSSFEMSRSRSVELKRSLLAPGDVCFDCVYMYTCIHVNAICLHKHTQTHTCTHTVSPPLSFSLSFFLSHTHTSARAHTHTHKHTHTHTHTYTPVCVCVRVV